MIEICEDESVYSFIYRSMRLYGMPYYNHVIGHNGLWHKYPTTPESLAVLYRMLPDALLLQLLQREGFYNNTSKFLWGTPEVIVLLLDNTFGGVVKKGNVRGVYPVVICQQCCDEMLHMSGIIWFKSYWRGQTHCPVHSLPLKNISGTSICETMANINSVLDGCLCDKGNLRYTQSDNYSPGERTICVYTQNLKFLLPCALYSISAFLKRYRVELFSNLGVNSSENVPLFFLGGLPSNRGASPVRTSTKPGKIIEMFYEIHRNDYPAWRDFTKHSFIYEVKNLGFNQERSIAITTIRNSDSHCRSCDFQNQRPVCINNEFIARLAFGTKASHSF